MEWLNNLFFEHSALQAVVVMAIIIAAGLGFGKIRLWGNSLGVTCVFFAGHPHGTGSPPPLSPRYRKHLRHALRKHGQPDGAELCQRHLARR